MAKEANKTVIGIFVLGAVFLFIIAVLVLGSGEFLKKRPKFVMFFDESVRGLSVGSPVVFMGVQVGRVTEVLLKADLEKNELSIPVITEFDGKSVQLIGGTDDTVKNIQQLIDKGLRAQLQTQSYVTGQLLIHLDLRPNTSPRLVGGFDNIPEIPTIPTMFEEISKSLQGPRVTQAIGKLMDVVDGLESFINSPELKNTITSLDRATGNADKLIGSADRLMASTDKLMASADTIVNDLGSQIDPLSNGLKEILEGYKNLAYKVDQHIDPLAANLGKAIMEITVAAEEAQKTLTEVKGLVAEDSPTAIEMRTTLRELSSAARSIRIWADYLESHPEALVWGKGRTGR